jgi:hypothetical protein
MTDDGKKKGRRVEELRRAVIGHWGSVAEIAMCVVLNTQY